MKAPILINLLKLLLTFYGNFSDHSMESCAGYISVDGNSCKTVYVLYLTYVFPYMRL